jgi:hypothetical protein
MLNATCSQTTAIHVSEKIPHHEEKLGLISPYSTTSGESGACIDTILAIMCKIPQILEIIQEACFSVLVDRVEE